MGAQTAPKAASLVLISFGCEDGGRRAESFDMEVESHLHEPLAAVHELSGGTEKPGNVRQRWRDRCPSADNHESSCPSGSATFPVTPAVRLLRNQDIRTGDSTKVSRTHCSLATAKEAELCCLSKEDGSRLKYQFVKFPENSV